MHKFLNYLTGKLLAGKILGLVQNDISGLTDISTPTFDKIKLTNSAAASKILVSDSEGLFSPTLVAEQRLVGRVTGGQTTGLTAANAWGILAPGNTGLSIPYFSAVNTLALTNPTLARQLLWVNASGNGYEWETIGNILSGDLNVIRDNLIILAWKLAISSSLAIFKLEDGVTDEFEDETGMDTAASENEIYNSADDYYSPYSSSATDILTGGTASASGYFDVQYPSLAVDNNDGTFWSVNAAPPQWWKYNLGSGVTKTVTKLRLRPYGSLVKDFVLAGSNNDSDWTDIYTGQHANDNAWEEYNFSNSTAYRYYRITISTAWGSIVAIHEIEMMETPTTYNMTLISNSVEAEAEPTTARFMALVEPVDAITLNTDLKAWISLDNGANYDQVTLVDEGYFDATKKIYAGSVDLTDRDDKTMRQKVTTLNNKNIKVHAWALMWR